MLLHDATLNRTTNGRGRLGELRFDAVNALDAGYARRFGNRWRSARIPTLDEALRVTSARGLPLCIEIKAPGEAAALVEKTVAAVAAAGRAEQAWIWSFNPAHLARVRRLSPATPLGILSFGWPSAAGAEVADMLVPLAGHALLFDADLAPRAGKPLIIWTVNQPRVARALAARGAAGLITDRAERMVPLLGGARPSTASAPAPTARASRR